MPRSKKLDNPLIHVATAPNEPIALMWAEILENEGIRCMVKRTDPIGLVYLQSTLLPCEIHVLASQAEKAKEILTSPVVEESDDTGGHQL
ncbi:MAG: DUF2007 domain-containing protein [Chloroflexi bacterium]|nr:DUF2007 domain-containing protein [Chloroflexota bacterium]